MFLMQGYLSSSPFDAGNESFQPHIERHQVILLAEVIESPMLYAWNPRIVIVMDCIIVAWRSAAEVAEIGVVIHLYSLG